METKKNQYSKPQLRTIELKADEVLSTGCKSASGSPIKPTGTTCLSTKCGGIGS